MSNIHSKAQCSTAAAKARSVLGMVKRHFRRLDKKIFLLIYKSYIRPPLEYWCEAWSPYLMGDIRRLEQVGPTTCSNKTCPWIKETGLWRKTEASWTHNAGSSDESCLQMMSRFMFRLLATMTFTSCRMHWTY